MRGDGAAADGGWRYGDKDFLPPTSHRGDEETVEAIRHHRCIKSWGDHCRYAMIPFVCPPDRSPRGQRRVHEGSCKGGTVCAGNLIHLFSLSSHKGAFRVDIIRGSGQTTGITLIMIGTTIRGRST